MMDKLQHNQGMPGRVIHFLTVALIVFLSAMIRIDRISDRPLWYDELFTQSVVENAPNLSSLWSISKTDGAQHPALFYVLSWCFSRILEIKVALRATSVLAGVLSVFGLFLLGVQLRSWFVGVSSALLFTLSVYAIEYSQDARPYMLLVCEAIYLHLFLVKFLKKPGILWLAMFSASAVVALYTHHFALFLAPSLLVMVVTYFMLERRNQILMPQSSHSWSGVRVMVALLGSALFISLCYLPQISNLISFAHGPDAASKHTLRIAAHFLSEMLARWGNGYELRAAFFVLLVLGLCALMRGSKHGLAIVVWLFTPFLFFSIIPFSKFFDIRYLITAFPAFYLSIGVGIEVIGKIFASLLQKLSRRETNILSIAALVLILLSAFATNTFIKFRAVDVRCSNFFYDPRVLEVNDSFCHEYLILNSLNRKDSYILSGEDIP